MKTEGEIVASWTELFERRRAVQPDDTQVADVVHVKDIWNAWCHEWMITKMPFTKNYRIFNAWVRKTYGSKQVLLPLLETGLTWAPPSDMVEKDFDGASEHVAQGG